MAGLLNYDRPDPLTLGLLGFSQAISAPRSRGGGVAAALGAFPAGQMQAAEMRRKMEADELRKQLAQAQIGKYQFDMDTSRATSAQDAARAAQQAMARQEFESAYEQSGGKWSPQLSILGTRAGFKTEDLQRLAQGGNLGRERLAWQNGVGVDAFTGLPQAVVPDVNQPFNPSIGPGGRVSAVPNQPVQDFQVRRAAAGAPSITTRVENQMGDSVAGQIGGIVVQSRNQAIGAAKTVETTDRMLAALNSGAFLGPGSGTRTAIARLSETMGAAGANTQEKLRNTRQLVQGLSKMALAAREQLRGTGTITDSEQATLQKAESGDIEELTDGELRDLISVARKSAGISIELHQRNIAAMRASPATTPQIPFFEVPGLDDVYKRIQTPPQGRPAAPVGAPPAARQQGFSIRQLP